MEFLFHYVLFVDLEVLEHNLGSQGKFLSLFLFLLLFFFCWIDDLCYMKSLSIPQKKKSLCTVFFLIKKESLYSSHSTILLKSEMRKLLLSLFTFCLVIKRGNCLCMTILKRRSIY